MIWTLLLLACSPDPVDPLAAALKRPLTEHEAAQVGDTRTFVVLSNDELVVGSLGRFIDNEAGRERMHDDTTLVRIALVDGLVPAELRTGQVIAPLFETLYERMERLTANGPRVYQRDPKHHAGRVLLLVDRQTKNATIHQVMFTAHQAQFGTYRTLLTGDAPPRPEGRGAVRLVERADPAERLDPKLPERIGRGLYAIDDRSARVKVDRVTGVAKVVPGEDIMGTLLHDASNPYLYPSFAEAAAAASYPVLPSLEMLMMITNDGLLRRLHDAPEADRQAWVGRDKPLDIGEGYGRRLDDAFQATVTNPQAPRVRDLMLPGIDAFTPPIEVARVAPELRIEPVPAHYERQAAVLRRMAAESEPHPDFARLEQQYTQAAATSRVDLGAEGGDVVPFDWRSEPALADDVRVMVPSGPAGDGVRVWAILGVQTIDIEATYVERPTVRALDGATPIELRLLPSRYTVLAPMFAELVVAEPLEPVAFREVADAHRWAGELQAALQSSP